MKLDFKVASFMTELLFEPLRVVPSFNPFFILFRKNNIRKILIPARERDLTI